jgi:hypothetical protein
VPLERVPPREVLLDANLLVLWVIGTVRPDQLGQHKRVRDYQLADFHLLCGLLAQHDRLRTTPNILTEVSNLLEDRKNPENLYLAKLGAMIQDSSENYLPATDVTARNPIFCRLGLSDTTTLELARDGCSVITADLDLYLALVNSGAEVVNFHHLREL